MIHFRTFRNTDLQALADLWQVSASGPALARRVPLSLLEYRILDKPYFDPAGLIVAESESGLVGFVHACLGLSDNRKTVSTARGMIAMIMVRPEYRRQGIGSQLLQRAEAFLAGVGCQEVFSGEGDRFSPFYLGMYRASGLAGVLDSLPGAKDFFARCGYAMHRQTCLWELDLANFTPKMDRNFMALMRSTMLSDFEEACSDDWWEANMWNSQRCWRFDLISASDDEPLGRTTVCELEPLSSNWGISVYELWHVEVNPRRRRAGVASYMMAEVFRRLRNRAVQRVQIQTDQGNTAGEALCRRLGLVQVGWGTMFRKALDPSG